MHILYTIDNHFVPQLSAGICSVCENNLKEELIVFHVIAQGLSANDEAKLAELCEKYHRQIVFYPVEEAISQFSAVDTGAWRKIIMARLLMGGILPQDIDRVLYLDGDTLVIDSLRTLWDMDMSAYCIGAVAEPTIDPRRKRALGLEPCDLYVNSGVMLVDLKAWREQDVESMLVSYCQENAEILFASDQDAINVVLRGRILFLTPNYNFCNSFYLYPYRAIRKMVSPAEYFGEKAYKQSIASPTIVHFLGEDRPWRSGSTHRYKDEYFKYLSLTAYADTPLEKGWDLYYKAWTVFNAISKPFPRARLGVINHLIPLVKKIRKWQQGN